MAAKRAKPVAEEQVLSSWEDFDLLSEDSPNAATFNLESIKHDASIDGGSDSFKEGDVEQLGKLASSEWPVEAGLEPATRTAPHNVHLETKFLSKETLSAQAPPSTGYGLQHSVGTSCNPLGPDRLQSPSDETPFETVKSKQLQETYATSAKDEGLDTTNNEHGSLIDLDFDSLCRCLELLTLRDICTVAQCCRRLREAAYSDPVWRALSWREWPTIPPRQPQPMTPAWRHLFFDRWKACRQFRFQDPSVSKWACEGFSPVWQIAVNPDQSITCLTCAELSTWTISDTEPPVRNVSKHKRACKTGEKALMVPIELPMLDLRGCPAVSVGSGFHPVMLTSAIRSAPSPGAEEAGRLNLPTNPIPFKVATTTTGERTPSSEARAPKEHFFLVAEDKVRLYSSLRGCCRTLSTTPPERVLALTDRVLDLPAGAPEAVIATGGEDKVVRLWTLGGRRKGEQRLVCTLRGHEDAIVFLGVARHDASLLVSVGSAGTVKLWDAASALELRGATAGASKSCVATWKILGPTAGMAMLGHVCYVAGKTAVTAIDLRSLRTLGPVASHADRISAIALNAVGDRLCTGTISGSVFLWDPTQSDFPAPKPLAKLTSHSGPVAQVLIDRFKVVTRTDFESRVHVSAADTGVPICSFPPEGNNSLQLEWRADKLLMAMRGPLLVLGKLHIVSADFSRSRIAYEGDERKEREQGSGDDLGRFWERPSEDVEDDSDED